MGHTGPVGRLVGQSVGRSFVESGCGMRMYNTITTQSKHEGEFRSGSMLRLNYVIQDLFVTHIFT